MMSCTLSIWNLKEIVAARPCILLGASGSQKGQLYPLRRDQGFATGSVSYTSVRRALLGTANGQEVQIFQVVPGRVLPISTVHRPCSSPQEVTSLCWVAHQKGASAFWRGVATVLYQDSCLLLGLSSGHLQVTTWPGTM